MRSALISFAVWLVHAGLGAASRARSVTAPPGLTPPVTAAALARRAEVPAGFATAPVTGGDAVVGEIRATFG
jgi:hypothetical protein